MSVSLGFLGSRFERISTIVRNELKNSDWSGELREKLSCCLILDRAGDELKRIDKQVEREQSQNQSVSRDDWGMER